VDLVVAELVVAKLVGPGVAQRYVGLSDGREQKDQQPFDGGVVGVGDDGIDGGAVDHEGQRDVGAGLSKDGMERVCLRLWL